MKNKAELVTRMILGSARGDIRPFTYSVEIVWEYLFVRREDWGEFSLTKEVYSEAAKRLDKDPKAVTRSAERIANRCWDTLDRRQVMQYIGKPLRDLQAPSEMLFYLAYYIHYNKPYFQVLRERYNSLFSLKHAEE